MWVTTVGDPEAEDDAARELVELMRDKEGDADEVVEL